jgi:molybdopterin-binding protein
MELGQVLKVQVGIECHATVVFTGTVTREAVDKLIQILELARESYASENIVGEENRQDEIDRRLGRQRRLDDSCGW